MDVQLTLKAEEVNAIMAMLGDMPTKTGAWVLLMKIQEQVKANNNQQGA